MLCAMYCSDSHKWLTKSCLYETTSGWIQSTQKKTGENTGCQIIRAVGSSPSIPMKMPIYHFSKIASLLFSFPPPSSSI